MVHIQISKGIDIPLSGKPMGDIQNLDESGLKPISPQFIALDIVEFEETKFRLLVQPGDHVRIGQPILEDKSCPGRIFASPAGGIVHEIRRGLKRRLLDIVIKVSEKEEKITNEKINLNEISRESLVQYLLKGGVFVRIRQRPFDLLANPNKVPPHIFIKAIETAPLRPPAELQVKGHEKAFQTGLNALKKLTDGSVHLVYRKGSDCSAFTQAENVSKHTVEGPHPAGNTSLHIQEIAPILSVDDIRWTLNALDVVLIGSYILTGEYPIERIISIGGPAILPNKAGYFRAREGMAIQDLIEGRLNDETARIISGDVLTGHKVDIEDFLGFNDLTLSAIPENKTRQFLHFLRLGGERFSASRAYLSGHRDPANHDYSFTTNQHGEHRPFIDSTLYNQVMPLNISTMHLIKSLMAEDYDTAANLGLLEVIPEDFALPEFVCPSKIPMTDILKTGLRYYAADVLE